MTVDQVAASRAHIEVLGDIPLLSQLGDRALRRLAESTTEVHLPEGHVLLEVGQEGCGLFFIIEGTARIHLGEKTFDIGPGEILGELTLLVDGLKHVARVQAATPITCLAIRREDFNDLLNAHPEIAVALLPVLARRLAEIEALV